MSIRPSLSEAVWISVGLACFLILVALCFNMAQEWLLSSRDSIKGVATIPLVLNALQVYQDDHATLPYDPKGPEYALYKLRLKYLGEELRSDRYYNPWDWDDEHARVVNSRYDYINKPGSRLDGNEPEVVILAQNVRSTQAGAIWYVTSHGEIYSISTDILLASDIDTLAGLTMDRVVRLIGGTPLSDTGADDPAQSHTQNPDKTGNVGGGQQTKRTTRNEDFTAAAVRHE